MANQIIKKHQIISTNQLIRALAEGRKNAERFCFIIGSGASVSSGIPTGASLEYQWMEEMERECGPEEIRETAKNLSEHLEYKFADIEKDWKNAKKSGSSLSSEYYFDIYKLRFYPNHRNGYHYLENIMANKNPGFGYHPLALMLTDGTGSNLVITTNFDSLIEDALFLYTNNKPLVINHELLADYAGDSNIKRPIIAKVHRGIFFDPLNQPEETNGLKGNWGDVLSSVFQIYTPIVIGYGGGDKSLMNLLENKNIKMKNGIYWCYYEKYGLPNDKIQTLVDNKNGYLVRTAGFDAAMLAIGNAFFPDKIGPHAAEESLNKRTIIQIENYEKEYSRLTELEDTEKSADIKEQNHQSEMEFKEEIEKIVKRFHDSEKERQESNQMTAWDHRRKGDQYYEQKQYEEAVKCYSEAIRMQSNIAIFYNDRGCAYNGLKKYDDAILDFNKAIELDPENANAYNNRGYTFNYLEKYGAAILDSSKAIELDPENANAYNNRGYALNCLKKYDAAMLDLNKAIELDPENVNAYNNRGCTFNRLEKYDLAISDLDRTIEIDAKYASAYSNRGYALNCLKKYDAAISDFNKVIELDSMNPYAYFNRSNVYFDLGENEKAVSDLNKAIEIDSTNTLAYNNRGYIYIVMKDYDKAAADLNKAIALDPKFANAYKNMGILWKNKADFNKAAEFLTKAIALNPEYKEAYIERAEVYRLMGESTKAAADEARAAEL